MRGRTRRGAGSIGLCWVLAVAVAGCTEAAADPPPESPAATAETSSSPTPTPTPTPVAPETVKPERPAAMEVVDEGGATAAAEYFMRLYPYVYATRDVGEWTLLSHPECLFCASVLAGVDEERASGLRSSGGMIESVPVSTIALEPGTYSVELRIDQAASADRDSTDAVVDATEAQSGVVTMIVLNGPGGWSIRAVEPQADAS